ncbi:hypothetical protein Fmac_031127 [Flemingia macrophylla]|uniref:Uncharacterized protein n=1 Tax=Flemingia macrophylla TaxID=520843 RepID=A0ABD1L175_9FABA
MHREDGVGEGKGDHRADEGMAANLDNAKDSAVPCQKSGITVVKLILRSRPQ